MFDFLFMGYQKRLKNRLNVRSFVRIISENNRCKRISLLQEEQVLLDRM